MTIFHGPEFLPIIQSGVPVKALLSELTETSIIIPEPNVFLYRNLVDNNQNVAVSWHCQNKRFLDYDPKVFLFRYSSQNVKAHPDKPKGFKHPVHQNGTTSTTPAWWSGASKDRSGIAMPPRNTEWTLPVNEGTLLELALDYTDWVYQGGGLPASKSSLRVRGSRRGVKNVHFYVAIAIKLPSNTTSGCPYVFGPRSEAFSLRPQLPTPSAADGIFTKYCWHIGG